MESVESSKVVRVDTIELAGDALSFAVAQALGNSDKFYKTGDDGSVTQVKAFSPWNNWLHGGPLFEQYHPTFSAMKKADGSREYYAVLPESLAGAYGASHLLALCRAVVLAEVGDSILIPLAYMNSQVFQLAKERDEQGQLALDTGPQDIAPAPSQEQREAHRESRAKEKPAQEAKPAASKPKATPKPKPAPQGKHAQALAAHAEKPAKGKAGK